MATKTDEPLSIVAVGAHMDDCWLGMGALALKAARRGHHVTMVQAVSQYGSWPTVQGRGAEVEALTKKVTSDNGIDLLKLGYDYMRIENRPATIGRLVEVIKDLRPDLLFCHWEDDSNQDHVALGAVTRIAAMHQACFQPPEDADSLKDVRGLFQFEIDFQTHNFKPDTFVDITDELYDALEIAAQFADLYARKPAGAGPRNVSLIDHNRGQRQVGMVPYTEEKYAHAVLYGIQAGCRYAEGFRTYFSGYGGLGGARLLGTI